MFSTIFRFFRDVIDGRNEWLRKTTNIPCDANALNTQQTTKRIKNLTCNKNQKNNLYIF